MIGTLPFEVKYPSQDYDISTEGGGGTVTALVENDSHARTRDLSEKLNINFRILFKDTYSGVCTGSQS